MKTKITLLALSFIYLSSFSQIKLDSLLVGYYELNGNAIDSSVSQIDGTTHFTEPSTDRFGNKNSALYFNGTTSYVQTDSVAPLSTNEYSISFWFKANKLTGAPHLLSFLNYDNSVFLNEPTEIIKIGIDGQKKLELRYNSTEVINSVDIQSIANNWIHVVATQSTDSIKFYINGNLSYSKVKKNPAFDLSNTKLTLGVDIDNKTSTNLNQFLNGYMDDVRIYSRPLSVSEIIYLNIENRCIAKTYTMENVYNVSSPEFESIGMKSFPLETKKLTDVYGCDSTVKSSEKYVFNPSVCTITKYDTVSVTDTLIITTTILNTTLTLENIIKVYPNPTSELINFDFGDFQLLTNYKMQILTSTGSVLIEEDITSRNSSFKVEDLKTKGLFFIKILDASNNIVNTKKLIVN